MNTHIRAEVWNKHTEGEKWEDIRERILRIERETFKEKSFTPDYFETCFADEDVVLVLLKDDDSTIIGFTYTLPIGREFPARFSENKETVIILDTLIEEKWRGHHLVGMMMDCLEDELRKRGYVFIEREARVENNYAAHIRHHYGDRIVTEGEPHHSPWGTQIFFRIKL